MVLMNVAKVLSLLGAGAFVAFALVYYDVVSDAGEGAAYALGLIALVWIVTLSEQRKNDNKTSERIEKSKGS